MHNPYNIKFNTYLLGMFEKQRKATVSFIVSLRLPV
jgi:hypothetical protein